MSDKACVTASFDDFGKFVETLRELKQSGIYRYEAYGPTNLWELEDLMPSRGSTVRGWATVGAIIGMATFWLMCVLSSWIYNIYVGGKPPVSNIPYVIPAYEGTILFGAIGAFIAVAFAIKLSPKMPTQDYSPRFSQDQYGIAVYCASREKGKVTELLTSAGASETTEAAE